MSNTIIITQLKNIIENAKKYLMEIARIYDYIRDNGKLNGCDLYDFGLLIFEVENLDYSLGEIDVDLTLKNEMMYLMCSCFYDNIFDYLKGNTIDEQLFKIMLKVSRKIRTKHYNKYPRLLDNILKDTKFQTFYYLKKLTNYELYNTISVKKPLHYTTSFFSNFESLQLTNDQLYEILEYISLSKLIFNCYRELVFNGIFYLFNPDIQLFTIYSLDKCCKNETINLYLVNTIILFYKYIVSFKPQTNHEKIFDKYIHSLSKVNEFYNGYANNYILTLVDMFGINIKLTHLKKILGLSNRIYITSVISRNTHLLDNECINLIVENRHYWILNDNRTIKLSEDQLITIIKQVNETDTNKAYNLVNYNIIKCFVTNGGQINKTIFDIAFNMFECYLTYKHNNLNQKDDNDSVILSKFILFCVQHQYMLTQEEFKRYIEFPYNYIDDTLDEIMKSNLNLKLTNEMLDNMIINDNMINACSLIKRSVIPTTQNLIDISMSNSDLTYDDIGILDDCGIVIIDHILHRYIKYKNVINIDQDRQLYDSIRKYGIIPSQKTIDLICERSRNHLLYKYLISNNVKFSIRNLKSIVNRYCGEGTIKLVLSSMNDDNF